MAKIITKKSQIPKSARKKIRNFSQLTDNQAIFEYELNKLMRRAKRAGVKFPPIFRPPVVKKEAIKELRELRGKKLKDYGKPIEIDKPTKPPEKEIQWDEVADALEQAKSFIEALKQTIDSDKNSAIISFSDYRSGRPRGAKDRAWISANITRAADLLKEKIDQITSSNDATIEFARHFMDNEDALANLQDAIQEYIAKSYKVIDTSQYFISSEVYRLLINRPMTMQEAKDLSTYEEGYEDEE